MRNETLSMLMAGVAGLLLGAIFFGGLWWTVRKGVLSEQPALWFFASFALRMSAALVGFYFVGGKDWRRLVVCLCGFIIARLIIMRLTRTTMERPCPDGKGVRHAP